MTQLTQRYSLVRPNHDDLEETRPIVTSRFGRGSKSPPPSVERPRVVHQQRIGEHDIEVAREGNLVTIALPGAVRLRGRPDQIRSLAAALLATLD